jgi:hypothetical protein
VKRRVEDFGFPEAQEHCDIPVLLSLPGVGRIITVTMLAEGAHTLSFRDYHALRAHAGSDQTKWQE